MSNEPFLRRTTQELLDLFAAGQRTPGAGSAAALNGALAASLIQAVALYTIKAAARREDGAALRARADEVLQEAAARGARLRKAVEEDAAAFERYWQERGSAALRGATELPLAVAEECAALVALGIELYDQGSRSARGEACAAILGAQAAGESAAYAARSNLRLAAEAEWAAPVKERAEELRGRLRALRDEIADLGL